MSLSPLERLKAKHAQMMAKPEEVKAKEEKVLQPTANKEVTAQAASKPNTLNNLLKRTTNPEAKKTEQANSLNSLQALTAKSAASTSNAVEAKIKEREEQGLYVLPSEAYDLCGDDADILLGRMRELDEATIAKTPEIASLSVATRKNLEQYPELVHILSEEQLGIIVQGFLVAADVELAPKTAQGKAAKSKKVIEDLSKLDVSDLF